MGWWRVYGGTDAHSDALFIGAAVACAQALGWVSRAGRWVGAAGAVTVGLVVAVSTVGQGVVRWGFVTVAIGTALIIVGVVAGDPIRRPLSWRPLAYLGKISYGLYLWHLPVFTAAVWFVGGPLPLGWVALLAAVSVGVASASYHFVERPALRLKRKYERVREGPLLGGDESQRTSPQHHRAAAGRQR
jgi:peptidoglycan/LPS O-acetylase OafA/YrhL